MSTTDPNETKTLTAVSPVTGATVQLASDVEVGELVDDPESGDELEVISLDPPTLAPAPEAEEDWGE